MNIQNLLTNFDQTAASAASEEFFIDALLTEDVKREHNVIEFIEKGIIDDIEDTPMPQPLFSILQEMESQIQSELDKEMAQLKQEEALLN